MNQVNEQQVRSAFDTAGVVPLEHPAVIAAGISAMLAASAEAFAQLPFDAEPASYAVIQAQEES
jgi:hypothetical protein